MDPVAEALAEHAARTRFADLPPAAVARAKVFLLDTLGVGLAGSTAQGAAELLRAAQGWGHDRDAAVWGTGQHLPAPQAVLVNAFQVHCQEYDCLHEGAVLHALATVLPVLLAEAGRRPVSGRALLTALAVGVDVSCRLGLASRRGLAFFRPATAGGFGAVAGLAHLRGLDAPRIRAAFGLQLAQASGTMQAHREGSLALPFQVGVNARAAWQAVDLVAAGLDGPQGALAGPFGFLPMFEGEFDEAVAMAGLGERWLVAELSHKPFPSGRATHGGVEGVMALRAMHGFAAEDVERVLVHGPPLLLRLVDRPLPPLPSAGWARLCMPFVLGKVLQHGMLELSHFRGGSLADPATHALAARIAMLADGNPDPNALSPQRVEVRLRGGQVLEHALPEVLANPQRPLSAEAHLAKFGACLCYAAHPNPAAAQLPALVEGLEAMPDIAPLLSAL